MDQMVRTVSRSLVLLAAGILVSLSGLPGLITAPMPFLPSPVTRHAATARAHVGAAHPALPAAGAATKRPFLPLELGPHAGTPYYRFGYSPQQVKGAYSIPSSVTGAGITVAIVDPYHDPNAARDFDVFSRQFGLPTIA